jgi:hypothetical protein
MLNWADGWPACCETPPCLCAHNLPNRSRGKGIRKITKSLNRVNPGSDLCCDAVYQLPYVFPAVDLFGGEADLKLFFDAYYQLDVVEGIPIVYIFGGGGVGEGDVVVIEHVTEDGGELVCNLLSFHGLLIFFR